MQDISDDLLAHMLRWLVPGELQTAGTKRHHLKPGGGLGQLGPLADGEAGTGLVGASTVFSNALIDGLVLWGDTRDGERPAAGGGERGTFDLPVTSQR